MSITIDVLERLDDEEEIVAAAWDAFDEVSDETASMLYEAWRNGDIRE